MTAVQARPDLQARVEQAGRGADLVVVLGSAGLTGRAVWEQLVSTTAQRSQAGQALGVVMVGELPTPEVSSVH